MSLRIGTLDGSIHSRQQFDCGVVELNHYLQKQAQQHAKKNISRTFVLIRENEPNHILGYYTVSNCQIERGEITEKDSKGLPYHPIPAIVIGRLAVSGLHHGKGYGKFLLIDAIQRCARVSLAVGVYAIVVAAIDESAKLFYEKYGFRVFPEHPMKLFLSMKTARTLIK